MTPRHFRRVGRKWVEADTPFGLGDAVAFIAQPVALFLDRTFGTHVVGCEGCAERQAALNRILPEIRPGKSHLDDSPPSV